ncbi:hypothetical protein H310_08390 [Aphanomyces invadans]|uniref:Uncharacterized protein n=1 Tax=Aphanomyces invadans TaxID=157072 RepID=A0A024TY37_9STRA|nr:hypothetical protein H310_08390 [Aphanomyces invadans]ETV98898.1 hypothetical protein H310_08390 [Aphanomyces invadans]|eukprot:XP_008872326.1 hypothetical protein H310_08390 [Aphanomyces invadans]
MTFLINALPSKHPLLASILFCDVQMAAHLRSKVTLLSTTMQPTGIPPRVGLHLQLETNLEAIRALPNEVREGVAKLLEDKGVTAGNITQSLLEEFLKKSVNDVLATTQPLNTVTIPAVSDNLPVHPVHFWGGRWHLLPEDFELPSVDVATGWHLWWCGSQGRGVPALFKLHSRDLTRKHAKILCEWSFAVGELQHCYKTALGDNIPGPYTSPTIIAAFSTITENLPLSWDRTQLGRQRRLSQMKMDDNGDYRCPKCDAKYNENQKDALRMHCARQHSGESVVFKATRSAAEKQAMPRERKLKWEAKQTAKSPVKAPRELFTLRDAKKRGVYGAQKPIVYTAESTIPNAGIGVFASQTLLQGDIVPVYEGDLVEELPFNITYVRQFHANDKTWWVDGLRVLEEGKASDLTKTIKTNKELFAVYGKRYRL